MGSASPATPRTCHALPAADVLGRLTSLVVIKGSQVEAGFAGGCFKPAGGMPRRNPLRPRPRAGWVAAALLSVASGVLLAQERSLTQAQSRSLGPCGAGKATLRGGDSL